LSDGYIGEGSVVLTVTVGFVCAGITPTAFGGFDTNYWRSTDDEPAPVDERRPSSLYSDPDTLCSVIVNE
jgi:hypothetical protein